jgi:uncharacterized sporulation protein YeaH/YhbH (DUF444 family)
MFAYDIFKALERIILDYVTDANDRAKYLEDLKTAKGLYRERIMTEMFNAYMDEPLAIRKDVMNYVNMIIGIDAENLGPDKMWKYKDPQTGELRALKIDERYINSVEERLGLKTDRAAGDLPHLHSQDLRPEDIGGPGLRFHGQPGAGQGGHRRAAEIRYRRRRQPHRRPGQPDQRGEPEAVRPHGRHHAQQAGTIEYCTQRTCAQKTIEYFCTQEDENQGQGQGGSGDGEEGEVIGEQPVRDPDQAGDGGPGQGEGGQHEMESSAYDLGKILTEQFELPNLQDKGKKRSLTRYTYDMTDRNRGSGQVLDKKATLREIVETNIHLGNIPDMDDIDPSGFIISPRDRIYRILSKEKDFESQAVVFFLRDYSGSMAGKATELVVTQHVLIYSWLLYQYANQVESRFILHDTEAKEVEDFYTYYNSRVAGGTQVFSAYEMVNRIVKEENLAADYNIYVFHGTDGDDWDTEGKRPFRH